MFFKKSSCSSCSSWLKIRSRFGPNFGSDCSDLLDYQIVSLSVAHLIIERKGALEIIESATQIAAILLVMARCYESTRNQRRIACALSERECLFEPLFRLHLILADLQIDRQHQVVAIVTDQHRV